MTVAGWVVLGIIGVLLAEAAFLTLLDWLEKRALGPGRNVETRIGELEARVDNLEAIIVALSRGEDTIPQSSGAMRADYKPGLPPLPPPPSPFPIRSIIDSPRKRKDLGPEDFHD